MELILTEWLGADGSFVSLSDDRILELNTDIIFKELFYELLKKLPDSKRIPNKSNKQDLKSYKQDLLNELKGIKQNSNNCNKYDSLFEELDKTEVKTITWETVRNVLKLEIEPQIREKIEDIILRIISYVGGNRDVLNKISKRLGINIPANGVINRKDVYFNHKDSLKAKIQIIVHNENYIEQIIKKITEINDRHKNGDANKNPICELKKIGEQYFIWTYQYAAEFEIPLYNENNKKVEEPLKIRIEPRNMITEKHYNKMLESVFNFQVMDSISGQKSSHFILLYLLAFIGRVEQTLQRGVYREYVDREENLYYLKERLLITDHLRENRFSLGRIYCAFSELSSDNIINRTINHTLSCIKRVYKNSEIHTRIRKIQNRLDSEELSNTPVSLSQIKSLRYNRMNKPYEEIMGYCYNILQNIGGSFGSASEMKYSAFYVDMNELFETYVGKLLFRKDTKIEGIKEIWEKVCNDNNKADDYYVETQDKGRYYLAEDGGAFNQEIRPDFLIKRRCDDSVVAVLDTKYKRLSNRQDLHYGIHREDMYQVITYGYRFNTENIFLIYPKSPEYSQENLISITIPSIGGDSKKLYIVYINLLDEKPETA